MNWNHVFLCILGRLKSQAAKNCALITGGLTDIVPHSKDGKGKAPEGKKTLNRKGTSLKPILLVAVVLLISIPVVWLAIIRLEGTAPALEIELASPFIGASRALSVSVEDAGSGIRKVWMGLLVDGREMEILQRSFPSAGFFAGGEEKSVQVTATVSPKSMGLADGKGVLRVVAWDYSLRKWGKGNPVYLEKEIQIDTQAPAIDLISRSHNLAQGGSGAAIYRLSEDCPVSGVTVGDGFYPGYAGHFNDPSVYMAFFALDYQQGKGTRLSVIAEDFAGNRSTTGLVHHINARSFRKDTINLSDDFFNAKMPDFERYFPESAGGSRLDLFLKVNRELRDKDSEAIYRITQQTEKEILVGRALSAAPRVGQPCPICRSSDLFLRRQGDRPAGASGHRSGIHGPLPGTGGQPRQSGLHR